MAAPLSSGPRVFVREFRVVGVSVLPAEELGAALAPFSGREIGSEELIAARDAVTALYQERGYVSSGAWVPDQPVRDGVVEMHVTEGTLGEIEVEGAKQFAPGYLRQRVVDPGAPLNIATLERHLQRLQQDPRIRRVDAHLDPGPTRDASRLRLRIEEEAPWQLEAEFANDAAPSLGGLRSSVRLGHRNPSGWGDSFSAELSRVNGLFDVDLRYGLPLTRNDLRLDLGFVHGRSQLVEGDFESLDVRAERTRYSLALTRPVWRDLGGDWLAGLGLEHARSELELGGEEFPVYPSQIDDGGRERVTALRAFQQLLLRSESQVFAARVQASLGLDLFGATIYPSSRPGSGVPDGRFLAWLVQLQWAGRMDRWLEGALLRAHVDAQLANDSLLPLERISVGGAQSVRGYHENELVRDNAVIASVELGVPVWRDALGRDVVQLVPFFDFAKAWNRERERSLESIASAGLGVRWRLGERAAFELFWGSPLRTVDDRDGDALQDAGLHLRIHAALF
jgi:hemolysin activation/secretion protein